ncbi:MAG: hypothetical protein ACW968_11625 [Candidatus Thorarchaeota archaeon]|jgi:hypothetical protein
MSDVTNRNNQAIQNALNKIWAELGRLQSIVNDMQAKQAVLESEILRAKQLSFQMQRVGMGPTKEV